MYTTLISVSQLQALRLQGLPLAVFDCSANLLDSDAGLQQYRAAHIPQALHAHLDHHLSDKALASDAAVGGRHPLPSREKFAAWLGRMGVGNDTQVVAYDRQGFNYCGRLWWMLRWCGHESVAILDGGLQAWQDAGLSIARDEGDAPAPRKFVLGAPRVRLMTKDDLMQSLGSPTLTIIDARAAARYRGETEPIDPVAGHIPGALNRPFQDNVGPDGRFRPAHLLRREFEALLAGRDPGTVVHHCGSGVSALANMIAMELAGLGPSMLYAGSWSEWCRDPTLPVARG